MPDVHADIAAAGSERVVAVRHLLRIDLPGLTLAMTEHEREISWAATTFLPDARVGDLKTLADDARLEQAKGEITLSGLDSELITTVSTEDIHYSNGWIWAVLMNEAWEIHGEPKLVNSFIAGAPTARYQGKGGELKLQIEDRMIDLSRRSEVRANDAYHKRRAASTADDDIFGWAERIPGRPVYWGGYDFEPGSESEVGGGGSGSGPAYDNRYVGRFR